MMSEEKSLQKVTDFEEIVDKGSLEKYLEENETSKELTDYLYGQVVKFYAEKDMDETKILDALIWYLGAKSQGKKKVEKLKNITYEVNQQMIAACIHNHVLNNGYFPQVTAIQNVTGLSRTTIYRHLKLDDYTPADKLVKGRFDVMATYALEQLYKIGVEERNHTALKTFIEMVNGSNGVKRVNNYIQINNLKLTKEEFEQLPDDVILQIESLISSTSENN